MPSHAEVFRLDVSYLAFASVALSQILNVAHDIEYISFIEVNGERVRVDYGVPRYWGDADSAYCGFASYRYQPFIFVNTACEDNARILRHEIKHIEQAQWYYHPAPFEERRPYEELRYQFEVEAYEAENV